MNPCNSKQCSVRLQFIKMVQTSHATFLRAKIKKNYLGIDCETFFLILFLRNALNSLIDHKLEIETLNVSSSSLQILTIFFFFFAEASKKCHRSNISCWALPFHWKTHPYDLHITHDRFDYFKHVNCTHRHESPLNKWTHPPPPPLHMLIEVSKRRWWFRSTKKKERRENGIGKSAIKTFIGFAITIAHMIRMQMKYL